MTQHDSNQVPGLYRRRIGDVLVTAISDGYLDATYEVLRGIDATGAETVLRENFRPAPPRISVNCYLLQSGTRTALIDTGSGDSMGPTLGKLHGLLASLGVAAGDVDTILLTHMHPDHSNGLADADGTRLFPEARLVVNEKELAHWHDDAARSRADETARTRYFDGARAQVAPYRDRLASPAGEPFPNVTAVPLAGHTPGHTGYLVASGGDTLLIWGDICHVPDIQVRQPEVTMVFDVDPDEAIRARRRAFDMTATDRMLVAGMHLHFPGFCHMVRNGSAWRMIPEAWHFTA